MILIVACIIALMHKLCAKSICIALQQHDQINNMVTAAAAATATMVLIRPVSVLLPVLVPQHCYHAACIDIWLRRCATCPLCKQLVWQPQHPNFVPC